PPTTSGLVAARDSRPAVAISGVDRRRACGRTVVERIQRPALHCACHGPAVCGFTRIDAPPSLLAVSRAAHRPVPRARAAGRLRRHAGCANRILCRESSQRLAQNAGPPATGGPARTTTRDRPLCGEARPHE